MQVVPAKKYLSKEQRSILMQKNDWRAVFLIFSQWIWVILAFALAQRVQNVMSNVISFDQTGYIKKRFIGCNIRLLQDIIDYTDKYNKEGALLFLDFKKAFDSLEWSFLHKVIEKFNFGPNFQKWVEDP